MKNIFFAVLICCGLAACNKLVDTGTPQNQLTTDKVFTDTVSAKSALFNIYVEVERGQYPVCNRYLSVYSDEGVAGTLADYNQGRLSANDPFTQSDWLELYLVIYQCNSVLEQLNLATALPPAFRLQVGSEAKFLRAYAYFYLINLYGRVPLALTTDVNTNRLLAQSDSVSVYNQVISDLNDARASLSVAYPGAGRIRANRACATAMLAKVYFGQRNWAQAEGLATELIASGTYTPLDALTNVFKISSKESILQLGSQSGFAAEAGSTIPSSSTTVPAYYLTDGLYNSFESGDLRKTNWIGTNTVGTSLYRYANKYKNRVANTASPENLVLIRLSEMYLIRAEARAWQGKLNGVGGAAEDVNMLRTRAGLGALNFANQNDGLVAIANERRHELFFENADRFLELRRTGRIQNVMSAAKPAWVITGALLPIPLTEIANNPNLIQNAGY